MVSFQVNRDEQGIHIPHKHFFLILSGVIVVILVIVGIFVYRYFQANYYDSSTNGSEIAEVHQQTIPPDVKQEIKQEIKQEMKISTTSGIVKNSTSSPTTVQYASVSATVRVPILMYHYIEYLRDKNDKKRISLNTTPYTLEEEIKTLIGAGYNFITNTELADLIDGKTNLPPNPILLTFDDGYRDFYTDAYPILKKYRVKATQYVIAGFLDRNNHLLTPQLKEIAKDGLVEIGAHTVHHVWLKGRSLKDVSNEVFQSREILEHIINMPVVSFAYPFGAFDEQTIQIVKDAGFRTATSTVPGIEQNQINRFFLYRLRPGGRTGQALLNWLGQSK